MGFVTRSSGRRARGGKVLEVGTGDPRGSAQLADVVIVVVVVWGKPEEGRAMRFVRVGIYPTDIGLSLANAERAAGDTGFGAAMV